MEGPPRLSVGADLAIITRPCGRTILLWGVSDREIVKHALGNARAILRLQSDGVPIAQGGEAAMLLIGQRTPEESYPIIQSNALSTDLTALMEVLADESMIDCHIVDGQGTEKMIDMIACVWDTDRSRAKIEAATERAALREVEIEAQTLKTEMERNTAELETIGAKEETGSQ